MGVSFYLLFFSRNYHFAEEFTPAVEGTLSCHRSFQAMGELLEDVVVSRGMSLDSCTPRGATAVIVGKRLDLFSI